MKTSISGSTHAAHQREALPLSSPDISALEQQYVADVLASSRLALGPRLEAFEGKMAARCDTRHAVAVSSGTAALHCIVRSLGLGAGDEIITTPFSFVASANAALFEDARPRFVDIDPTTYNLDAARVKDALKPQTRAILAVDVFGAPADWPALTAIHLQPYYRERFGYAPGDFPLCEAALGPHAGAALLRRHDARRRGARGRRSARSAAAGAQYVTHLVRCGLNVSTLSFRAKSRHERSD